MTMQLKFFPHQTEALDETEDQNRVGYYLDMGLGKTFVGAEKMKRLDAAINLVVCQKSKVDDWVEHFINYYPNYSIYNLTDKTQFLWFKDDIGLHRMKIGVINYDLIFRRNYFLGLKNFTITLDESSMIQNDKAKRTKFILKMNPKNVILLSGTPTAGKYENLWSQLHLTGWGISQAVYNRQYVNWVTIKVGGFPIKVVDKAEPYKNVDRLKRKMREHGAVFMKTEEVFDLPEQTFIEVKIKVTKEYRKFQKTHIITMDTANLCEFKDDSDFYGTDVTPRVELVGDTPLTHRLYSRMLCGHFNKEKLNAFRDLCSSTNDRLIVFYNYNDELTALKKIVEQLEKPMSEVNGLIKDMSAYDTEEDSITFVQYKAGAMGLNLQKANKIIYFTLTDESELFEQSKKRIHRIGQDKPCFYYLMVCQKSIEDEELLPTLGIRKQLTDELFKE